MFNLTHDESSSVDIGGVWTGPDEFEFYFKFNHENQEDLEIHMILNRDELISLVKFIDSKLAVNKMRHM
jgi:hypothetical protein